MHYENIEVGKRCQKHPSDLVSAVDLERERREDREKVFLKSVSLTLLLNF